MSAPRSVLLDMHAFGEDRSGNETYVRNLARHLIPLGADEFRFHLAFGKSVDVDRFAQLTGLRAGSDLDVTVLATRQSSRRLAWTFPLLLARHTFDVAHFQYVLPLRRPPGTRLVTTIHDLSYRMPVAGESIRERWIRRAIDASTRHVDHVVTISGFSRGELLRTYPHLTPAIVTNASAAVDADLFRRDPHARETLRSLEERLGTPLPKRFCLTVGNLHPRKNLPRLLEAFSRLRDRHPDLHLVVTGQRRRRDRELMHALRDDRILWTDWVPERELVALYSACALFVFPSLYEGFGLPVLEAVACGAPALTSRGTALPEICPMEEGLFDPRSVDDIAARMDRVLSRESLLWELREMQAPILDGFSWKKTAAATLGAYRSALESRQESRDRPSSSSRRGVSAAK